MTPTGTTGIGISSTIKSFSSLIGLNVDYLDISRLNEYKLEPANREC